MFSEISNVKLEMITSTVSKNRIPVFKRCEKLLDEKKSKRLEKVTGIVSLSIVPDNVCTSDLCFESATRIFESDIKKEDIGAVVFLSQTPDYAEPATSCILQDRLKLPDDILAFDISLGCSGFVYGTYVASLIAKNIGRKVLFCCGDISTKLANPEETSGASISGDAGSAAIISPAQDFNMKFNLETIGEKWNAITLANGFGRLPRITDEQGNIKCIKENYTQMNGTAVMDFSLYDVPKNIDSLLSHFEIQKTDLDLFILHQAQKTIVSTIGTKLGVPHEKVPYKVSNIGNVSSASIPVCLSEMKKDGEFSIYKNVLLSGFGVGLSIASVVCDFSSTAILPTGEL